MRGLFFWLHRWLGLALALYVIAIGVSGSLLVFRDELFAWSNQPTASIDANAPRLAPADIERLLRQRYAGWHLHTLHWPRPDCPYWFAEIKIGEVGRPGERARALYVDPRDGSVASEHDYGTGVLRWLQLFHFNLLAGREGREWNAWAALGVLFLSLSGLILWWPRQRSTPFLWRLSPARRLRRTWELHQLSGLYALAFIAIVTLTGAYFAWRAPVHQAIAAVLPMRHMSRALEPVRSEGAMLPLDFFDRAVREAMPGEVPFRVLYPERPGQPLRMVVYHGSVREFYRNSNLFFDPVTGRLMRSDLYRERGPGDTAVAWIGALHFGAFGGLATRVLWLVGGLFLPFLAGTGFLLYRRRSRVEAPAAKPAVSTAVTS